MAMDNTPFLGLKLLSRCTHRVQVRLLTTGYKGCITCAADFMISLGRVVEYFDIQDGPLNEETVEYLKRRHEPPSQAPIQTPNPSGGAKSY